MPDLGRLTQRRKSVLKLLASYGPLSRRALAACIYPPIQRRKLNQLLATMEGRGQLSKVEKSKSGRAEDYFRLPSNSSWQLQLAALLDAKESEVAEQGVANFALLHSETCAMWAEYLKLKFSDGIVIQERFFSRHQDLSDVFLQRDLDRDFVPDLVLKIDCSDGEDSIYIAFEIERFTKSKERLLRKLTKYANETRFDGVVYICDSTDISKRLLDIYQNEALQDSLRIKHYGANFVLFSDGSSDGGAGNPLLLNGNLERVNLTHWVDVLRTNQMLDRRNAKFSNGPLRAQQVGGEVRQR